MISIDEALDCYARHINPLDTESLALDMAVGRVLADGLASRTDLPRFDQSAMDGYACRHADLADGHPLTSIGTAAAGADYRLEVGPGECVRILTGGVIPTGADTVVPQERTSVDAARVSVREAPRKGANIRRRGEELTTGAALGTSGQRLSPGLVAALVMGGTATAPVYRLPRIAVLSTGDELCEAGSQLATGQIHDSNGPLIRAWLAQQGLKPVSADRLPDDPARIRVALATALEQADLVLSSGGVSVGDRDYLIPIAEELGVQRHFWKVAQKPGKPLYFGTRNGTALLGLPGNPGAVLAGLVVHARRIIDLFQGCADPEPVWHRGRLAASEAADRRRDRLLRMAVNVDDYGQTLLEPLGKQDSHMLSNLTRADTLVRLPVREQDYAAGEVVDWTFL